MPIEVLLIEDNPGDARLVKEMLSGAITDRFSLTHVVCLTDGMKVLAEREFDVLLLDLSLPDAHGLETIFKARDETLNVPFIIMSSLDDEALAIKAVQEGAQDYLVKGQVDANLLVRSIRYSIERKRLLGQLKNVNEKLVLTNLKERGQAEEARRRATELDTVLDSIADGIVLYGPNAEVIRINHAAEVLLNYSFDGKRPSLVEHLAGILENQPRAKKALLVEQTPIVRALKGETVHGVLLGLRCNDKVVWVSTSAAPILAPDGTQVGAVATFTDMTDRRQVELFREEYVSLISHDLRNPLTVLISQAEWLCRLLATKELDQEFNSAAAIMRSSKRMNAMIQDLLETTRLETGQMEMHSAPADLYQIISDLVGREIAHEDQERVKIEVQQWVPPVNVDPNRIERAIINLLTNALKYTPDGSSVSVQLNHREDEVYVSVVDSGTGIAAEDLPFLFDRFYRARTGKKTEGLGLGLYITRLIVEAHGGRIWVESEYGSGSSFHFTLPVVQSV